ncbi:choice-of-anchor D domain-containing protein [Actinoplanes sp. KI2]|uniref:choice-of-anchor D domain-containing protein n=1 Tax=Actinoplanes sp. KI2 TaxID=2983315 RepID=UPI0021D5821E|nr:choice-of-anchor D domain-containing protein [Actinoplanes sp. KI2]MCU7722846.1 choice-of-anchor D domain-containing protein [Actinoplanes sp. KI2]
MRRLHGVIVGAVVIASTLVVTPALAAAELPVTTSPDSLSFGEQKVGEPGAESTVTVTSTSSDPITLGTATITGSDAAAFNQKTDTCSGATLAQNEQCRIGVVPNATAVGSQTATLTVSDSAGTSSKTVPLSLVGSVGAKGAYYAVTPARVLDTRSGVGAPRAMLGTQKSIDLQVTGRGGVPLVGVSAVVLNVTVTGSTAGSFLTVYPTGAARPTASSINFAKGWTGANSVTVGVGTGGDVRIYNEYGATHVIADVVGFYAADSTVIPAAGNTDADFYPMAPQRWIDTRADGNAGRLGNGDYYQLGWNFGASYNPYVRAVAVNITAVSPNGSGYLSAWNGDAGAFPSTSTLNYTSGRNVPNLAIVPTSPCYEAWCSASGIPMIGVINTNTSSATSSTHLIVDIVGVYDNATPGDGLRFRPITPQRITDTRSGLGYPNAFGPGASGSVTSPASFAQAYALAFNVTGVKPTANTYLTLWPTGLTQPTASNLNPAKGQTVANAAIVGLGTNKAFSIYNYVGTTDVLVDVVGTFQSLFPAATASSVGAGPRAQAQSGSISGGGSRSGTPMNGTHLTH